MDCTEGAKRLTSCFVPTFVWYLDTEFRGEKVASIEFHQVTHLGDNYLKISKLSAISLITRYFANVVYCVEIIRRLKTQEKSQNT